MEGLNVNFAGPDWLAMERWLENQKQAKVQRLIKPDTSPEEVQNIRGALQFIDMVLSQKKRAALAQIDG